MKYASKVSETWYQHPEWRDNDWALRREARPRLWMFDPILRFMIEDDVDSLIESERLPGFDCDSRISLNGLLPFDYVRSGPSYIGLAAFCRAIKCYRFLRQIGAGCETADLIQHTPTQFAAASGSLEILRDLEMAGASDDGVMPVAAGFSRYSIFNWISETKHTIGESDDFRTNVISQAAIENNMFLANMCFETDSNINVVDSYGRFPLYKALAYESLEVAKMLLSREDIDCTLRYDQDSLLDTTAYSPSTEVCRILIEDPRFQFTDIDVERALDRLASQSPIVETMRLISQWKPDVFRTWWKGWFDAELSRRLTEKWTSEFVAFSMTVMSPDQRNRLRAK